jgi:hypothetical protein
MQPDLSPEDCAAIAALLRDTIAADRFPMSPRIKRMRAILNKLDPTAPKPVPVPPLKPSGAPSTHCTENTRRPGWPAGWANTDSARQYHQRVEAAFGRRG